MAVLAPAAKSPKHLAEAKGWLNDEDAFFETIDHITDDHDSMSRE